MRPLLLFFALLASFVLAACARDASSGFVSDAPPAATSGGDGSSRDAAPVVVTGDDDDDASPPSELDAADPPLDDPPYDAGVDPPPIDAAPEAACTTPIRPGDLAIVELMIASVTGSGDHGEWIEIASTRDCALPLRGLHGECPVGAKVASFDVTDDVWLPPGASFVVADSGDPSVNHDVPPVVVAWTGVTSDVLRNLGATVTLRFGSTLVDSITYPALKLPPGTSLAFPSDCDADDRATWAKWQPSAASWFPAFRGTPNGPNGDVHCPLDPPDSGS